jgi:hypothetical protein
VELTPEFLNGMAGQLALECRVKDYAISQLEGQLAAVRAELGTVRAKLDALADHHSRACDGPFDGDLDGEGG